MPEDEPSGSTDSTPKRGRRRKASSGTFVVERTPLRLTQEDLPTPTTTAKDDPCCLSWDLHEAAATQGGAEAVRRYLVGGGDPGSGQWGNSALHVGAASSQYGELIASPPKGRKKLVQVLQAVTSDPLEEGVAAHEGHDDTVRALLRYEAQVDQRNRCQETPLHLACRQSHAQVVRLLLENGADPRSEDICGRMPIDLCSDQESESTVADLLSRSEKLKDLGSLKSRVHIQVCHDSMGGVHKLLEVGGSIDTRDSAQRTLLHRACEEASVDTVAKLLELGATVNTTEKRKQTPLHRACERGRLNIVRLLVEKGGADTRARAKLQHEPLHVASLGNWGGVVKFLLTEGKVDVEAADKNGMRCLHLAVQRNRLEAIRELLKHGCDVEATLSDGLTRPLHIACSSGYEKAATLLLEHQADINARGPNGHRPLHLAAKEGATLIVELLIGIGGKADLHAKDDRGRTALMYTNNRRCKERIREAERREERAAEAQRQLVLQQKRDKALRRREQELLDRVDLRSRARTAGGM